MFVDEVQITVRSGSGGRGAESYQRRADHKRIPNGGDGGDGGDVIVRADPAMGNLDPLRSRRVFEAERGSAGSGGNQYGRKGRDILIRVPCGTTVYNKSENLLIRDLVRADDEITVLTGGRGGYGNHAGREPTLGKAGQTLELVLSLKIIADIFLLGLPNSGKTALLRRLTNAHVSETEYPFATKAPQLGTYQSDFGQYRLCELPSLYEHSHEGRGLGMHFLKHLERARLVFLVLDPRNQFADNLKKGYDIVRQAVERFNPEFLNIPRFVVINKADLIEKKAMAKNLFPKSERVYFVSALSGLGLDLLMADASKRLSAS